MKRSRRLLNYMFVVLIVISICLVPLSGCNEVEEDIAVKNIILLIGDGMADAHIEAAKISEGIDELNMEKLPYNGYISTLSLGGAITDSAAAGTAFATGQKVYNSYVSWLSNNDLKSITEYCIEADKNTGIIATKPLYDATPATFSAHSASRYASTFIAEQQVDSNIDVLIGEGKDTYDTMSEDILGNGYEYINTKDDLESTTSNKIFAVFDSITPSSEHSLEFMSEKTINTLDENNENGFFLMIEGSKIDTKSHDNDLDAMIAELIAFDQAVQTAMDFAESDGNTMVIVTSDHETGDLIIPDGATAEELNDSCYHSGGHTDKDVPYFAYGGNADEIPDAIDNIELFDYMMQAFKFTEE